MLRHNYEMQEREEEGRWREQAAVKRKSGEQWQRPVAWEWGQGVIVGERFERLTQKDTLEGNTVAFQSGNGAGWEEKSDLEWVGSSGGL